MDAEMGRRKGAKKKAGMAKARVLEVSGEASAVEAGMAGMAG
jgi:hypothetical protein